MRNTPPKIILALENQYVISDDPQAVLMTINIQSCVAFLLWGKKNNHPTAALLHTCITMSQTEIDRVIALIASQWQSLEKCQAVGGDDGKFVSADQKGSVVISKVQTAINNSFSSTVIITHDAKHQHIHDKPQENSNDFFNASIEVKTGIIGAYRNDYERRNALASRHPNLVQATIRAVTSQSSFWRTPRLQTPEEVMTADQNSICPSCSIL